MGGGGKVRKVLKPFFSMGTQQALKILAVMFVNLSFLCILLDISPIGGPTILHKG